MRISEIVPNNPPPGGAYSQAIAVWDTELIYLAGHVGVDTDGVKPESFSAEVLLAIENLERSLESLGGQLSDLVQITCLLTDIEKFAEFDAVYRTKFGRPFPARATYGVALANDLRFEITGIAARERQVAGNEPATGVERK